MRSIVPDATDIDPDYLPASLDTWLHTRFDTDHMSLDEASSSARSCPFHPDTSGH